MAKEEHFFPPSLIPEYGELEKICRLMLDRIVKGHVFDDDDDGSWGFRKG